MYASGQISGRTTGPFTYRIRRQQDKARNPAAKKDSGSSGGRNSFLTKRFSNLGKAEVVRDNYKKEYNYITRSNYDYLLKCAQRYALLLGVELNHRQADSYGAGIANLYHELDKIVGSDVNINFRIEETKLEFVLWKYYDWGYYSLYYLPLKFLEHLPVKLRRLTISFLHEFQKGSRIDTTNHNDYLSPIFDWQEQCAEECEEAEKTEIEDTVKSYQPGGRIFKLMERIRGKCYHKNLPRALERYKPESDYERTLIELMKKGLVFSGENKPCIYQYDYDRYEDEFNDDYPVMLDQRFMFIYDYDNIIENHVEYLNEQAGNSYETLPCATLHLSPDTTELFSFESYPQEFFSYMDELKEFLDRCYHGL